MINAKKILRSCEKADSAAIPATNEEKIADVTEKISADVSKGEILKNENEMKENSATCANVNRQPVQDVNDFLPVEKAIEDVPIYTATAKEIHYWHACVNIHILDFLRTYDLDRQSVAFNSFCVGVDDVKHALTFAIEDLRDLPLDENARYLKIDLNDTNVRPIDKEQAEKVLRVVNARRFEQIKFNPCYRARTWYKAR